VVCVIFADEVLTMTSENDFALDIMLVITHDGAFHCDEVCAAALLCMSNFGDFRVIRTRNLNYIEHSREPGSYVIDVGGVYDHDNRRYDHHQRGFAETWSDDSSIPLSSFGLIYRHYGRKVIENMPVDFPKNQEQLIESVYHKFYQQFVVSIDANDNGVNYFKGQPEYNYRHQVTLPMIIGSCNNADVNDDSEQMTAFHAARFLAQEIIHRVLMSIIEQEIEYFKDLPEIKEAIDRSHAQHRDYLVLSRKIWWGTALNRLDPSASIKLIVSPRGSDQYQVNARKIVGRGFDNHVDLVSPEIAKSICGDDLVFMHNKRFICVTKTLDKAEQIAQESIRSHYSISNKCKRVLGRVINKVCKLNTVLFLGTFLCGMTVKAFI